jgi:methylenetetrahydrofolate--tRNA-(uracil-5-)-methyltransferase
LKVCVIGAGLAGSEAALQLAKRGIEVDLYEMRPKATTGAHKTEKPAELVCSNSLGSLDITGASGLLREEMSLLGSYLIEAAKASRVPAGAALAVDREVFSTEIERLINENPYINYIKEEITQIPDIPTIIASGPLTADALSASIKDFTGEEYLAFFDAIAPIIEKNSIDFDKAFYANRYNKGEACYINCPMNKEQYDVFYNILINAPKIELKDFERDAKFFESCLPVEVLASRGVDTLRFGPMKPVGLVDDRTGEKNYAVVQLRQDDMAAELYNMVGFQTNLIWGAQKELIKSIPGLENANVVRYGVMHKNMFIFSPKLLNATLQSKKRPDLFFAGQITGTEGYTESIASGLMAGINMSKFVLGDPMHELSQVSMLGALLKYITFEGHSKLSPINSNWGIVELMELPKKIKKDKKQKNTILANRSLDYVKTITI